MDDLETKVQLELLAGEEKQALLGNLGQLGCLVVMVYKDLLDPEGLQDQQVPMASLAEEDPLDLREGMVYLVRKYAVAIKNVVEKCID